MNIQHADSTVAIKDEEEEAPENSDDTGGRPPNAAARQNDPPPPPPAPPNSSSDEFLGQLRRQAKRQIREADLAVPAAAAGARQRGNSLRQLQQRHQGGTSIDLANFGATSRANFQASFQDTILIEILQKYMFFSPILFL